MKDITKSPIEMVNWLLNPWAHGIERPLFGWNAFHRLWYVGKVELLLILTNQPGSLCCWHWRRKISLPNDPSIFEELLRCWLAPPLEFHFVYATQKAHWKYCCIGRVWSGYITKSRRNLSCLNLKYSQFVDVPANFASCTIITAYVYQFST